MKGPKAGVGMLVGLCLVRPFDWGVRYDSRKFGWMVHAGPVLLSFAWEAWDAAALERAERRMADSGFTVFKFHPEKKP